MGAACLQELSGSAPHPAGAVPRYGGGRLEHWPGVCSPVLAPGSLIRTFRPGGRGARSGKDSGVPELQTDGTTIWYEQTGNGPDLVWVPGGDQPGSDWRIFQVPYFDDSWRNTTYDPRGVGRTRSEPQLELSIAPITPGRLCESHPSGLRAAGHRNRPLDGIAHRAGALSHLSGARALRRRHGNDR